MINGNYMIISHDDEEMDMQVFGTLEEVKKCIKGKFDKDQKFDEDVFKKYFTESCVDGDSYSVYYLFKMVSNKLVEVFDRLKVVY